MQLCLCAARTPHRSSSWPFLVRRSLQHLPSLASSRRTSALPSESAATSQSSHLGKTTAKAFPLTYRTGVQTRYSCATLMGAVVWLQLSGPSSIICRAQATKTTSSKPARCRFRSSTLAARPRQVGGNARQRRAWSALHRFACSLLRVLVVVVSPCHALQKLLRFQSACRAVRDGVKRQDNAQKTMKRHKLPAGKSPKKKSDRILTVIANN